MLESKVFEQARISRDARFDGRFFIAVRTTGIYCRPVCPANTPKSENVTFYPTAAAAGEAGVVEEGAAVELVVHGAQEV